MANSPVQLWKKGSGEIDRITKDLPCNEKVLIAAWIFQKPQHTQRAYRQDLIKFYDYFPNVSLKDITYEALLGWVCHQEEGLGHSPPTINRSLSAISSLFIDLMRRGYVESNPVSLIKRKKIPNRLVYRIQSLEETKMMIKLEPLPRNKVLIRLIFETGLRRDEVTKLKFSHIIRKGSYSLLVITGKGQKTRTIRINEIMLKSLESIQGSEAKNGFVFRSLRPPYRPLSGTDVYRIYQKASKRVGKPRSPHEGRHGHASQALRAGADLRIIQESLGHSSPVTTTKYIHVDPEVSSANYIDL